MNSQISEIADIDFHPQLDLVTVEQSVAACPFEPPHLTKHILPVS